VSQGSAGPIGTEKIGTEKIGAEKLGVPESSASVRALPAAVAAGKGRSPMAQLLHALNQPLTGLQCSLEVALASPRTNQQYRQRLQDGLELTERMRELVEAIRETADAQEECDGTGETVDLRGLLREAVEDVKPMAEEKRLRIVMDISAPAGIAILAGRRRVETLLFRFLEAALSLALLGTELKIELRQERTGGWLRVEWRGETNSPAISRCEMGLLVAQAGWERLGAIWERQRTPAGESITLTFRAPGDRPDAVSNGPLSPVASSPTV
jgi:hypothetical protein